MAEWQPIETAPKDKRKVLIFHAADDDGDCYKIAYWSDLAARPGWFYRGGWLEESEPDGWMPLPDPPIAGYLCDICHEQPATVKGIRMAACEPCADAEKAATADAKA